MGMSTNIIGFRPPDEKWKKMKAAWDSCREAGIDLPDELWEFFGGSGPDEAGIKIDLEEEEGVVEDYTGDGESGYDVLLSNLPDSIDRIRFYNSW